MNNFDGHPVTRHEANLKGRCDVDEQNNADLELDRLAIMVVMARVNETKFKPNKVGDVIKTSEVKIEDFRVLTGQQRENAINFLAHGNDQGALDLGLGGPLFSGLEDETTLRAVSQPSLKDPEFDMHAQPLDTAGALSAAEDDPVAEEIGRQKYAEPVVIDHDAIEVDADDYEAVSQVGEPVGTIDHLHSYKGQFKVDDDRGDQGPKVAKFGRGQMDEPVPTEIEQVGNIYGHPRKDKVLDRFLREE